MKIIRTEKELDQVIKENNRKISNIFIDSVMSSKLSEISDLKLSNCLFYQCTLGKIHGDIVSGQVRLVNCDIKYLTIGQSDSYYDNNLNVDRTFVDKGNPIVILDSRIEGISTPDVYCRIANSRIEKIRGNRIPGVMHSCKIERYIANDLLFDKVYSFGGSIIKEFYISNRYIDDQRTFNNFMAQSDQATNITVDGCEIKNCKVENLDFSKFTFGVTSFKDCTVTNCNFSKCKDLSTFNKTVLVFDSRCVMENNNFGNAKKTEYNSGGVNYKFHTDATGIYEV